MTSARHFALALGLLAAIFSGCAAVPSSPPVLKVEQQELVGKKLHWQLFKIPADREGMDHFHCPFCMVQLVEAGGGLAGRGETDGYTTDDGMIWVCNRCFDRLNPQFHWSKK